MNGIELCAKYAFITNKLQYCGPHNAFERFKHKSEDTKQLLEKFEGLYPYLQAIAAKHHKLPFDKEVVEAYWIGNELLDVFTKHDMQQIILSLSTRGLPQSYAKKVASQIPIGFVPHHSFNVLYVGVGKITGSVSYSIENINNCLIRPANVQKVRDNQLEVIEQAYVQEKNVLVLDAPKTIDVSYEPLLLPRIKKGDTISIHWYHAVDILSQLQQDQLRKYTEKNISVMNALLAHT